MGEGGRSNFQYTAEGEAGIEGGSRAWKKKFRPLMPKKARTLGEGDLGCPERN